MKEYKLLFFSIITLLVFIISPIKVSALSYKSDYIDLKSEVYFQTDEFQLGLGYSTYTNGTADRPGSINGEARKKNNDVYYYHYVIYYYDESKEEIGVADGYNGIWDNLSSSNGSYISSLLDQKNMQTPYQLSDIRYYTIFIEPSTETLATAYLYENHKKINMDGIDPISDFDTVTMVGQSSPNNYNNDTTNTYGNGQYALTNYKVDIKVNENNTFNITEYITAYFNINKHGIFRKIPFRNEVVRLDGTKSHNWAKISDIEVDEHFSTYSESGYKVIKIGDPNLTITGSKNYTVSYLYNIGKDTGKGYDELYLDLIGNEWDTTISNVEFTITMPKNFDKTKLGFSSGEVGSIDSSNITYDVKDRVITGKYNGILNSGEGLTVRLELPEGYFVGASDNFSSIFTLLFGLPVVFALISFLLWSKYGKDDKVIETVGFYPPEGFNSAEVGFLYKGQADKTDVVSLLIYLANKGYIKIEEIEEKTLFSTKKGFKIIKIRDYDGSNINEKVFLNRLFNSRNTGISSMTKLMRYMKNPNHEFLDEENSNLQEVTSTDLYDNFYVTLRAIISNLNDKENKNRIYEKSTSGKSLVVILMIILSVFIMMGIPTYQYYGIGALGLTLFVTLFFIPFYAIMFAKNIPILFRTVWGGIVILQSSLFFSSSPVAEAIFYDSRLLLGFLIDLVCVIIMIICFKIMKKRTPYGNEMLGKIKGFKTFLETAEKPKLEELVMQNPSYFYNILPYTYVLGVSDTWIKKFEVISMQAPDWYSGSTSFNMATFGSFMSSTMSSASSAMSSSPSSSGSGGSGGGSSGGGSGGGGGGSW